MWDGGCWPRWEAPSVGSGPGREAWCGSGRRGGKALGSPGNGCSPRGLQPISSWLSGVVLAVLCPSGCCGTHLGVLCLCLSHSPGLAGRAPCPPVHLWPSVPAHLLCAPVHVTESAHGAPLLTVLTCFCLARDPPLLMSPVSPALLWRQQEPGSVSPLR